MKTLIFATNNLHKVAEIQAAVGDQLKVVTLKEAGIHINIPEPHDTLEANAAEKSGTIFRMTGSDCFSEDTGLEVESLQGRPGVHSARYAGTDCNDQQNIEKLLHEMNGSMNRKARFRTVISLIRGNKKYQFEGICEGEIAHSPKGSQGFGYDPIFIPAGSTHTFAEMTLAEKNQYSHRRKAAAKLIQFLLTVEG